MLHTPIETLCHTFQYLDRNEVEKCQLINKRIKSIVENHNPILPLRQFYQIQIGSLNNLPLEAFITPPQFQPDPPTHKLLRLVGVPKLIPITPSGEISDIATKTIKYASFYNFTIYEMNETVLNLLKKLVEICGDKIKCDFVLTWASKNYEEWAKVLTEYVTAQEVLMKIDEKDSNKFLATPIHLPVPPHEIQVNLYKNYSLKNLLHFIGGGDLFMPNRYRLDFYEIVCEESEQKTFCENLLQKVQTPEDDKTVYKWWMKHGFALKQDEGDAYPSFFHQELRRLLEDQKLSCEKVRTEVRSSYYDIYEYHRSDGWCLKILFNYYSKTNDRYVSFTFILNNGCADVDRARGYLD